MPLAKLSLKGRALKLLSQREHSRRELEAKLGRHEEAPGELKRALDELQARGFIDEKRAADSIVHRRAARFGAARVKQELLAKGIGAERVGEAMSALRATEFDRAREVWRSRFGIRPEDAAQRAKQARFLAARGFSGEIVARVLRQAGAPDED